MVSPYASFKATIDAEMPTPRIEWSTLTHNSDIHHAHESAFFVGCIVGCGVNMAIDRLWVL